MTPNLRVDQHNRRLTAFGQLALDQKYRFQRDYSRGLFKDDENEQSETRREYELERVV